MIERYTRPEMGSIWTLENRYKSWLDVEIAVCKAWAEKGRIPEEALQNIIDKAEIDADRILAIEEITRHDIIAFLTALEEKIGPDARFIHLGCTSSDIVDTAGSLLLVQAGKIILKDIDAVLETIKGMAMGYAAAYPLGVLGIILSMILVKATSFSTVIFHCGRSSVTRSVCVPLCVS